MRATSWSQKALRERLDRIYRYQIMLANSSQMPTLTNAQSKTAEVAMACMQLLEWIGTAEIALADRDALGLGDVHPIDGLRRHILDWAIVPSCGRCMVYCPLTQLTSGELQSRLFRWKRDLRLHWRDFENALQSVGIAASDMAGLVVTCSPTVTTGQFRTPLRNQIFLTLTNLGIKTDYKRVANYIEEQQSGVVLPARLKEVILQLQRGAKEPMRPDIGWLATRNRAFARLFEKEVSHVRRKMCQIPRVG